MRVPESSGRFPLQLDSAYRVLFERSPSPTWIFDLESHVVLAANAAALARTGYSEAELVNRRGEELLLPDDRERALEVRQRLLAGVSSRFVYRFRRKDGTVVPSEAVIGPIEIDGRRAVVVVIVAADPVGAGERRRVDHMLHMIAAGTAPATGKDFFRSLVLHLTLALEAQHAVIGALDPGRSVVRALAVASRGELLDGQEWELGGTPGEMVMRKGLCYYAEGLQRHFPHDRMLASWGVDCYLGMPLRSAAGDGLGLVAVLHDRPLADAELAGEVLRIAAARASAELERTQAEAERHHSEATVRALLEGIPDLVVRIDRDGRYRDLHVPVGAVLPMPADQMLGRRLDEVLPADAARDCLAHLQAALSSGETQIHDLVLPTPLGARIYEVRMCPRGVDDVLAVVRDVSADRRREEELRNARRMESLAILAGGVAHDFNNLLTGISGFSELALASLPDGAAARAHLDRIQLAATRAAELTRQVLAYAGRGRIDPVATDLGALVDETVGLLGPVIGPRAAIRLDLAPGLPEIEIDPPQMRQVVMNLLTNAAESLGGEAGRIELRTRYHDRWPDDTSTCAPGRPEGPGPWLSLEVEDDGAGMDAETVRRIFEPFFTTKFAGRGLGLAAVLGIVRAHGGAVCVASEPGRGSRFRVSLPVRQVADRSGEDPGPAGSASGRPCRVLVADDEDSVRNVTVEILRGRGYDVVDARDGRQGLALFRAAPASFGLVLLDVRMPGLGGLEVLREMRRIRPDLPAILLSGYSEDEMETASEREPVQGFLAKPFRLSALVELVARLMGTAPTTP